MFLYVTLQSYVGSNRSENAVLDEIISSFCFLLLHLFVSSFNDNNLDEFILLCITSRFSLNFSLLNSVFPASMRKEFLSSMCHYAEELVNAWSWCSPSQCFFLFWRWWRIPLRRFLITCYYNDYSAKKLLFPQYCRSISMWFPLLTCWWCYMLRDTDSLFMFLGWVTFVL